MSDLIDPKFKDVKVGDWIFTIQEGWTKTVSRDLHVSDFYDYTIRNTYSAFTLEGRFNKHDLYPSAWTYDPFNDTQPPYDFKEGEVIAVRDIKEYPWVFRIFIKQKCGLFHCYNRTSKNEQNTHNWIYARKFTQEERGEQK